MGFKVRGYTRDVSEDKVRDYSLFAIATEGTEREPDYFKPFNGIDRIKVDIIEPDVSDEDSIREKRKASSPSKVLEKVKAYIAENQLSAEDGDSLWCVIDVDRWPQEQIAELHSFCAQKDNWHLVISNPCIEIWLLYHKKTDLRDLGIQTAKDAKQALDKLEKGGYYYIKYLPLMLDAIENASKADTNPDSYMPEPLQTKVYLLGRALYERMGKVRFEKFVASLPSIEKEILKRKMANRKG
ncbi:MAG: RloB domain-containing protein [Bacteroidales bacterium]|nr:RloB domain-containing protein [Bacteroidales bacterium]